MAIRNGSKQTISVSGGLEPLQMLSEPDTKQCASMDARTWAVTNGIRAGHWAVWLELLQMVSELDTHRCAWGLGGYKWYQSQTLNGVPTRMLRLWLLQMVSKPDTGKYASEDSGPQGRWIVRSHVGWRRERNIPNISYKGVETFL